MPDIKDTVRSLASALPDEGEPRDALIAVGIVASGILCQTPVEKRAELIETFCKLLKSSASIDLN